MKDTIHRLVYYSRNRIVGPQEELAAAIHGVLAASRRNNPRAGVTGALMFNAGCFAQVLEGTSSNVEHVFERIQQDDRHSDVSVLSFSPAPGRIFENWSMSFAGVSVEHAARFGSLDSSYDPSRMGGDSILETLHRLVIAEEAVS